VRTALRKMGNSTGMILPKAMLSELGIASGAAMELSLEGNRIIATPVATQRRVGWAEAAAAIVTDSEAEAWQGFANEADDDLTW
jgi:antitoxin MazE